jgi:hypothetical protein
MPNLPELAEECFFIAPIGSEGSAERERSDGVLEFIVDRAAKELNLTAVRADKIADPGQITLQVIDHILGAKAAVADVTGLNPNVFYELAVRHTARLPVAIIAEKDCKLPFDIAQMRTIFFESTNLRSADQCRRDVVTQLNQALEKGAVDSPIATSVDVRNLAGGSTIERNVAEIITTMEDVARSQRDIVRAVERLDARGPRYPAPTTMSKSALTALVAAFESLQEISALSDTEELDNVLRNMQGALQYLAQKNRIPMPTQPSQLDLTESKLTGRDEPGGDAD